MADFLWPECRRRSETFIRAHAERLPAEVTVAHGDVPQIGDRPVLGRSWRTLQALARCWLCGVRPRGGWTAWATTCGYWLALGRYRPDAVLAEHGTNAVKVLEACRRRRVPLTAHFHGFDANRRPTLEEHAAGYRGVFAYAAAVVVVSRAMQDKPLPLGAPAERLHYNPYGVDPQQFQGAAPGAAPPTFLAVGRFGEKKAPHVTLMTFARTLAACPEARLRMIGEGPLLGVCQDVAHGLGLADAVTFGCDGKGGCAAASVPGTGDGRRAGASARRHVCETFSMERSITRLWEILQQAVQTVEA